MYNLLHLSRDASDSWKLCLSLANEVGVPASPRPRSGRAGAAGGRVAGWPAQSAASPSRHCPGRAGWHGARGAQASCPAPPRPSPRVGNPGGGAGSHRVTCTQSFPPCLLLGQFWPRRVCSEKNERGKGHGDLRRKRLSRVQGWGKRGYGSWVAECV